MLMKICKYMFILSLFAWLLPPQTAKAAGTLPTGGTIAGIAVDGLTYEEAHEKVQMEIDTWRNGEPIKAEGPDETISIPRDVFLFDIDRTFTMMEQQAKRPWYLFFLKPKSSELPLYTEIKDNHSIKWPDYANADATLKKAKEEAEQLGDQPVSIIYQEESELPSGIVAEAALQIPDISHVEIEQMAEKFDGQALEPDSQFSLINNVLEKVRPAVSQEGASFFASALYAAVLKTNMDVIERHSQGSVPSYSTAGIEADVDFATSKDFMINNPNFYSYHFSAEVREGKLHIIVSSILRETSYEYKVENNNEIKPRTLYRFSYKLAPGSRVPVESGQKGMQVEVYRISSVNGAVLEKTLISRDFYPPSPTIFLVSSQEPPEVIEDLLNEDGDISEETNDASTTSGSSEESNDTSIDSDIVEKQAMGPQSGNPPKSEEQQTMMDLMNKTCQPLEDGWEQKFCELVFLNSDLVKGGKTTDTSEDKQ